MAKKYGALTMVRHVPQTAGLGRARCVRGVWALFVAAFWLCAACEEPASPPASPAAPDSSTQKAAVKKITLKKPPAKVLYALNTAPAGKVELLAGAEINGEYTQSPKNRLVDPADIDISPETLDTTKAGEHSITVYVTGDDENTVSLQFSVWVTGVYSGQQPLAAIEIKTPPQVPAAVAFNFEQGEAEFLAALDWTAAEVIGYTRADKSGMVYTVPKSLPQFIVRSGIAGGSFGSYGMFGCCSIALTVSVHGRVASCGAIPVNVLNTKFKENQNIYYMYRAPSHTVELVYGKQGDDEEDALGTEQTIWVDEQYQGQAIDTANNTLNFQLMTVSAHGQTFVPLVPPLTAAYNHDVKAIGTAAHLAAINNDVDKKNIYVLVNDITVDGGNWEALGGMDAPFKGLLFGNGKKITFADGSGGGFLGWTFDAQVYDLDIDLGSHTLDFAAGDAAVGGADSAARWGGVVASPRSSFFQNVRVHGSVTLNVGAPEPAGQGDGSLPALYAGGFAGYADEDSATLFLRCAANVTLTVNAGGPFVRLVAGGFAGKCADSWGINQCYAAGRVTVSSACEAAETGVSILVGGFAGDSGDAAVNNCYALGNVTAAHTPVNTAASMFAGGFAGTGGALHTVYALGSVRADSANAASALYVAGLAAGGTAVNKSASLSPALTAIGGATRRLYRIMATEAELAAGLHNAGLQTTQLYNNSPATGAPAAGETTEGGRNGASTPASGGNGFTKKNTWTQLGFDFSSFWTLPDGESRPRLSWEPPAPLS